MAEIIYYGSGISANQYINNIRWLSMSELSFFNHHLSVCNQSPLSQEKWEQIYDRGTTYCILVEDGLPVARACVEKYSEEMWEAADVRVVKDYRNRGLAYKVCLFVLNYILEHIRYATVRTEEDNYPMQRVIAKLGFMPL